MQKMIMDWHATRFGETVNKWIEAEWTVVPGTQGIYTNVSGDSHFWVWMQEPKDTGDEITLDIYP